MSYDIPSVSELEAVQLLNKHYAEVITSKKDGIASGLDITRTTNPITGVVRRTLYKILDDAQAEHDAQISAHEAEHDNQMQSFENDFDSRLAGMAFTRVGSFTTGATLTDMRQVLVWEVSQGGDGHEYGWAGTFPKVVAAGVTPATSGGIGASAWVDRTDVTLRSDLKNGKYDSALDYLDFGAVPNNNSFDNYSAILSCHTYANSVGARVKPSPGVYNIGALPDSVGIPVLTDTDWSNCKFRLSSATASEINYGTRRLFSCETQAVATLTQANITLSDFFSGAISLPSVYALGYRNVVLAIRSTENWLLRNGTTAVPKQEVVVMFEGGLLSSPLSFSYGSISSIDVYPIETHRLQLRNLQFVFDGFKSAVGLYLQRNNVDLYGVNIDEADRTDNSYSRNFIKIYNTYNVKVSGGVGASFVSNGSYNFRPEMTEACVFSGIKGNGLAGGVFGGNYNKNIKYLDCDVSRIDQHALGEDCSIERCTIYDNMGISLTGKGKLTIRDVRHYVKAAGAALVSLRADYASTWDGSIDVDGVKAVLASSGPTNFGYDIVGVAITPVDFGTNHIFPNVSINNIDVVTDDTFNCLVTAYNLPNNSGVNAQVMPSSITFSNARSKQSKVRFRALNPLIADQPKYSNAMGTHINVFAVHNPYSWVHSTNYNIANDAMLYFYGTDYVSGTPYNFTATIEDCKNIGFVWTLPSELRVNNCVKIAAALTKVTNGTGDNFTGVHRAVWVSDSSIELMNYRTSQEFMLEQINLRDSRIQKPTVNTYTGSYRSFDATKAISYDGVVMDSDSPIISGQEYMINNMLNGYVNSTYWRTMPTGEYKVQSARFVSATSSMTTTVAVPYGYFSAAPLVANITPMDLNKACSIQYNYSLSTATLVNFTIYTTDGSNFTAGTYNFACRFSS